MTRSDRPVYGNRDSGRSNGEGGTTDTNTGGPLPPVPPLPPKPIYSTVTQAIKPALPGVVQFNDEEMSVEAMTDLVFEEIGGQEIINIARHNLVNGQNVIYSPIKNLSLISSKYNPLNLFSLSGTSQAYFNSFGIRFEDHVPGEQYVEAFRGTGKFALAYLDGDDIILLVSDMKNGYQVEIEVASGGQPVGDIIY